MLRPDQEYALHLGDCIEHMAWLPDACMDFSVYSPPFPAVFAYTSDAEDIGNSEDLETEARLHLLFFFRQIVRVIKPGRVMVVHVAQIPRMKRAGGQGLADFRGLCIRIAEKAGFSWEYDWVVRKNPQSQAIRNRAWELKFQGVETDRAMSRGALPDYLLKFRVPGENAVPIASKGEVSRDDWIKWAECCWTDIKEAETLNGQKGKEEARGEEDTRHICPLQLEVIRRLVLLYSNPGELVFSPFAGIGSELYMALKLGRRAYGCELKPEYHETALRNLERAIEQRKAEQRTLFDALAEAAP